MIKKVRENEVVLSGSVSIKSSAENLLDIFDWDISRFVSDHHRLANNLSMKFNWKFFRSCDFVLFKKELIIANIPKQKKKQFRDLDSRDVTIITKFCEIIEKSLKELAKQVCENGIPCMVFTKKMKEIFYSFYGCSIVESVGFRREKPLIFY